MKDTLQQIKWLLIYPRRRTLFVMAALAVGLTALDQYLYYAYDITTVVLRLLSILFTVYTAVVLMIWAYWRIQLDKLKTSELDEFEIQVYARHKTGVFLSLTWIINVLFSFYYLYVGLRYNSAWFETIAFFYVILATCRLMLLRQCTVKAVDRRKEWRQYGWVGVSIIVIAFTLALMSNLVVFEHSYIDYPGSSIYIITAWTIYLLIYAVVGLFSYRRYHSPLLSGIKSLGFAAVFVGVYSLQASLLNRFTDDADFQLLLNRYTAIIIFSVLLAMGSWILMRSCLHIYRDFDNRS